MNVTDLRRLLPPVSDYPYFSHAADHPFEAGADTFSPVNAGWLADA